MGRDPSVIEHSAAVDSRDGGVEEALQKADALREAGVTLITVGASGPDYDLSVLDALCRWRDAG